MDGHDFDTVCCLCPVFSRTVLKRKVMLFEYVTKLINLLIVPDQYCYVAPSEATVVSIAQTICHFF
jgi:hypothetical protein